ncbi:hypothetical protein KUCAC02_011669, partial [Chaenocephalus aceratus]
MAPRWWEKFSFRKAEKCFHLTASSPGEESPFPPYHRYIWDNCEKRKCKLESEETIGGCQVCAGQGRIGRLGRGMDVRISGWLAGRRAVKKTQGLDRVRRALLLQDGGGSGGDDGRLSKGDRLDKGVRGGGGRERGRRTRQRNAHYRISSYTLALTEEGETERRGFLSSRADHTTGWAQTRGRPGAELVGSTLITLSGAASEPPCCLRRDGLSLLPLLRLDGELPPSSK